MSAGIFRPIVPNQAVATLLLIENSRSMANVWADLRDHYLQRLDETLERSYPPVPTTMFVIPSLPASDDQSFCSAVPHQSNGLHNGLRDFRFNYDTSNRLTPARISSCIDFLASAKFQGQTAALHLVIVAATAPSEDTSGLDLGLMPHDGHSVWHLLSEKLTQADILCHIVLASSHNNNMRSLTSLFEDTMHLQKNVEVAPWFPINPDSYIIRLSSRPGQQAYSHPGASLPLNTPHSAQGPTTGVTISSSTTTLPRNHSFPPDSINATSTMRTQDQYHHQHPPPVSAASSSLASPKPDPSPPPSLVSQLQQVHGLTKKKVYGAKPARAPFFRDERPPAQLPVPLPLTLPLPLPLPLASFNGSDLSPPASSAPQQRDGRVPSHSRVDRLMRLSQGSGGSSPTTDHHHHHYPRLQQQPQQSQQGQGRTWPRRGSRLSSPEGDALPSPGSLSSLSEMSSSAGTSYFSSSTSGLSSPVSPCETIDDGYGVGVGIGAGVGGVAGTPGVMMSGDGGVIPEPPWLQQHQHVPHEPGGFGKAKQARMAGMVADQQQFYPAAPMSGQPMSPFNHYTATANTTSYDSVRTYLPPTEPPPTSSLFGTQSTLSSPATPPPSIQSVSKSTPTPPKSHTRTKSTLLPSTPLDLSLDSLPPLSPDDGDKPFFIFEEKPLQEASRSTASTALLNDASTVPRRGHSPPRGQRDMMMMPGIRSTYSSPATAHPTAGPRQVCAMPPYSPPAVSPPATFYDQAGYFDYSQTYDMNYEVPSYGHPITTTTSSSLTGWAG